MQEIRTRTTPNTDTLYAVTDYSKSTAGAVDSRGIFRTLSMMEICYLKRSRSRHPSRKQFTLCNYTVYLKKKKKNLKPDEILEPFDERIGDLSKENDVYSNYINSTS